MLACVRAKHGGGGEGVQRCAALCSDRLQRVGGVGCWGGRVGEGEGGTGGVHRTPAPHAGAHPHAHSHSHPTNPPALPPSCRSRGAHAEAPPAATAPPALRLLRRGARASLWPAGWVGGWVWVCVWRVGGWAWGRGWCGSRVANRRARSRSPTAAAAPPPCAALTPPPPAHPPTHLAQSCQHRAHAGQERVSAGRGGLGVCLLPPVRRGHSRRHRSTAAAAQCERAHPGRQGIGVVPTATRSSGAEHCGRGGGAAGGRDDWHGAPCTAPRPPRGGL